MIDFGSSTKIRPLTDDLEAIIDECVASLEDDIRSCDFRLNKYTWDGKTPYDLSRSNIVIQTRSLKAEILLKIRYWEKLKKRTI